RRRHTISKRDWSSDVCSSDLRPEATDEEVYAAAKLANADQFIKHLPQGYDTVITGNGEGLSQGQRQLLSIARAALDNAPVLILRSEERRVGKERSTRWRAVHR